MAIFNNSKEETTQSFSMQSINNIGQGTLIEGNIKTEGDIRIDGKLNGNINSKGRCVLGPTSQIIGNIESVNGNIDGQVKGDIIIKDVLRITKTAKIEGNITTKKLIVDEGAIVQAKITMLNTTGSNVDLSATLNKSETAKNLESVQNFNR